MSNRNIWQLALFSRLSINADARDRCFPPKNLDVVSSKSQTYMGYLISLLRDSLGYKAYASEDGAACCTSIILPGSESFRDSACLSGFRYGSRRLYCTTKSL